MKTENRLPTPVRQRALLFGVIAMLGAHAGIATAHAAETTGIETTAAAEGVSIMKMTAQRNATGLSVGFYESKYKDETMQAFGRRPSVRTNFDSWRAINDSVPQNNGGPACITAQGWKDFDWTPFFEGEGDKTPGANYIAAHRRGQTIYGSINISFTERYSKKQAIPSCYAQTIADPRTRAAALAFVRSYTRAMLERIGSFSMTIDYEIIFNYGLAKDDIRDGTTYPYRAEEWSAWYVEAVGEARKVAKSMGREKDLFLMPIVNGNPMDPENPLSDPADRSRTDWLRKVAKASDALGIDSYYHDPAQPFENGAGYRRSDPDYALKVFDFWIKHYAHDPVSDYDRPVIVTENGFKALPDALLTPKEWALGKYIGTPAEQARYYEGLSPALLIANAPGGRWGNRVKAFHLWTSVDNYVKEADDPDRYFGLLYRQDTAAPDSPLLERESAGVVNASLSVIEEDKIHRPFQVGSDGIERKSELTQGLASLPLVTRSGTDFDFVRYANPYLRNASNGYTLTVELERAAPILVNANGAWSYHEPSVVHTVTMSDLKYQQRNVIDVQVTGDAFPSRVRMKKLALDRNP